MAVQSVEAVIQNSMAAEAAVAWYQSRLGFVCSASDVLTGPQLAALFQWPESTSLQRWILRLGEETLQIWGWPAGACAPYPDSWGGNDRWFQHICLVSDNLTAQVEAMAPDRLGVISSAPQTLPDWNPAAAGIQAFKFKDPDGHPLELLQFPADKGDPRWHQAQVPSGQPKGFDHSAISIANTEVSLGFYRDVLGFALKGQGVNSGIEQDRMDGLPQTRVAITAIGPSAGAMGIEFLNYQSPPGGRDRQQPLWSDLCDRKLLLKSSNLRALHQQLLADQASNHCSALVAIDPALLGAPMAFTVRDPDGHGLIVMGDL